MNNSSTVAMISLGCPKNLVNSEEMLALLQDAGYAFTDDLAKADAAIINTCAFIESAKTEAIEKILETASYREENPELKIIVSGCLAQRYADDIRAELCMEIQAEIMGGFAETFIGRELDVLVMGREPDGTPWGRSEYDSPDIDSRVIFSGGAAPGDMVRVRIDSVDDGELIGEQI